LGVTLSRDGEVSPLQITIADQRETGHFMKVRYFAAALLTAAAAVVQSSANSSDALVRIN
jgi:hypothetical protein